MTRLPRRILFLTSRLRGGGSEHVLFRHALALDRRRFIPEILTFESGPAQHDYEDAGVRVACVPPGGGGALRVLRFRRLLKERCASGDIELVHAWITITALFGPQVVRSTTRTPVIVSQRNLGYWLDPIRRQIYRWSNRRYVDTLVVNSDAVRRQVISGRLCPKERIRVVPNGVDVSRFRPGDRAEARRRLGLEADVGTIGMVGTLKAIKGQEDLVAALSLLADEGVAFQAVLVGEGADRAELERRARQAGLGARLRFLGLRHDVEALYPAFDVCVSCSRTEGFPNVVLEAMACGCALVVTPVGGVPEVIRDGIEGLHYTPGDVPALAAALRRLLRETETRERMGLAGRQRAMEGFNWDTMQQALESIYEAVLNGSGARR